MFDLDQFIADCRTAGDEPEPRLAVKEVLARAVSRPDDLVKTFSPQRAEIVPLYVAEDLSVFNVVWTPGMRAPAHTHEMWAAIAIYGGVEDNTFYRRVGGAIAVSGGRVLPTGDVALLGADVIHAVANPANRFTGAIHVYGGNLTTQTGRSEWDDVTLEERPFDFVRTREMFEAANRQFETRHAASETEAASSS
jgi:predicted metal-dependent enzyme (double-stranded beta helix superfamily)